MRPGVEDVARLVLWDIDGTLVHAGDVAAAVFDEAVTAVTGSTPPARVRMSGKTDPQIAMEYIAMVGATEDALGAILWQLERALAAQRERIRAEGRVLPGVEEALRAVAELEAAEQSLLTGNIVANARVKLEAFAIASWFDFALGAYGSDDADRTKLVPIALERWRVATGQIVDPRDVLVVGDSPNDLACARAVGAECLLVATGRSTRVELALLDPDHLFDDLTDTARLRRVVASQPAGSRP